MPNSNEYMREYMLRRYHERRALAYEMLGGCCVNCGTTENLQLDHPDREGVPRSDKFAKNWNMPLKRFKEEVLKCQLLCEECHGYKSRDEISVVHGGGVSGKKNCPCELCRSKKAEYMRNYKRNR